MTEIKEILPGLVRIPLNPLELVNVYLLDDVLVDSGMPFSAQQILQAISGRPVTAHALTHAHPDHQGSSHAICERLDIPLWCGEADRGAMESGNFSSLMPNSGSWFSRASKSMSGPPHPVARSLKEGDQVGSFTVIATPGHTPGHLSFWRQQDRALITGDVIFNLNPLTMRKGLREPFKLATYDPALNRKSAKKIAALEPSVICFGHGPPLTDPQLFLSYVNGLPGAE